MAVVVAPPPLKGFLALIDDQIVRIHERLTLTAVATHPKGQPLKFSLGYLSGATIDPTTSVFEWAPTSMDFYQIAVCAKETDSNASHCRSFKVRVLSQDFFSTAISIDRQGQKTAQDNIFFFGKVSMEDQFGTSVTVTPQQEITVSVNLGVSMEHFNQQVDWLFVIAKEPPPEPYLGNEDTIYHTVDQNNQEKIVDLYANHAIWMAQFDAPFNPKVRLQPPNTLEEFYVLWQGTLEGPTMYYLFMGYRLSDGTIVYNSRPLTVKVI